MALLIFWARKKKIRRASYTVPDKKIHTIYRHKVSYGWNPRSHLGRVITWAWCGVRPRLRYRWIALGMVFKKGPQRFSCNFSPSSRFSPFFEVSGDPLGNLLEEPPKPSKTCQKVNTSGPLRSLWLKLGVFDRLPPWNMWLKFEGVATSNWGPTGKLKLGWVL